MKTVVKVLSLAVLVGTMSGCVVAVGDHDFDQDESWRKEQQANKNYINGLSLGTSIQQVRNSMGSPAFSESFQQQGELVEVLYFRTEHRHSDGETTKDECTPLIFKAGKLSGWGAKAYQNL